MKTTAVRGRNYVLNGTKCFITNGTHADWYTVYAKTDKEAGHRGISAFVVPRATLDGVAVDKKEDKLGQRASDTATISFNDVEVPAGNLIGEENKGFKLAMQTLDRTRPGVAAMAVGIANAAFEFARDYAKERVQFGVPIAMLQAIQFMIADMATKVEAARLLRVKSAVDSTRASATRRASHAKRFAADSAMEVTVDAVQVYGGYGFIKEYPVEKLMRDAKIMQLYEGTSQIQRLVIAAEVLMPRQRGGAGGRAGMEAPPRLSGPGAARMQPRGLETGIGQSTKRSRRPVRRSAGPTRSPASCAGGRAALLVLHLISEGPSYGNQLMERIGL